MEEVRRGVVLPPRQLPWAPRTSRSGWAARSTTLDRLVKEFGLRQVACASRARVAAAAGGRAAARGCSSRPPGRSTPWCRAGSSGPASGRASALIGLAVACLLQARARRAATGAGRRGRRRGCRRVVSARPGSPLGIGLHRRLRDSRRPRARASRWPPRPSSPSSWWLAGGPARRRASRPTALLRHRGPALRVRQARVPAVPEGRRALRALTLALYRALGIF